MRLGDEIIYYSRRRENHDQEKTQLQARLTIIKDNYLNTVQISRTRNCYIWWSANAQQFINLKKFSFIFQHLAWLVYEAKWNCVFHLNAEKFDASKIAPQMCMMNIHTDEIFQQVDQELRFSQLLTITAGW